MADSPYYLAYEERYKKVYGAGIERWGHSPEDVVLQKTLSDWVSRYRLWGKKLIEFACGEGACGQLLSGMGCRYCGVDIAPSAVAKAREALRDVPGTTVRLLDLVNHPIADRYAGALDVMGFHMLILDADRKKYLQNAYQCLNSGAPMLFFRESFRKDAPQVEVREMEEWLRLTGSDYSTPVKRTARQNGKDVSVYIPLVPARAKSKDGYLEELQGVGFVVDDFVELADNDQCCCSAAIYVHKP